MYKLLIIDDQKGILQMLRRRFTKLDYEVFTADNKDEALRILESELIDLVLLDYMMPQVSGLDFFLHFHKKYDVPVIMMTAHSSINLAIEFMRSGGADFVEKPLDIDVLHLRIERAIKQSQLVKTQIMAKQKAEANLKDSNTALLEKTEKLEQKNEELDAFTAAVSHDLKAPVRNIMGFISLLKRKLKIDSADQEVKEYFGFIEDGAGKMNELITELLNFAQMKEITKDIELIDTQRLVTETVNSINLNTEHKAQINIGILPQVKGDLTLIRQVFFNLIHNAIKYSRTKEKPTISVTADRGENETIFAVKDNGVGFNMEYTVRLFNMFVRLHPNEFEGTGVGLANVKRIVERHNGRIWALGEEGKGATFYFSLPD